MLKQNQDYYNQNAFAFSESTLTVDMQPLYNKFLPFIKNNGHILDAGCGSGRDSKYFNSLGYLVTAIDASEALVSLAQKNTGLPVQHKTFQQIDEINQYDGIWCCASLLHVPLNELGDVFWKLSQALKKEGAIYVSFKYGEPQQTPREHHGRTFTDLNECALSDLLNHQGALKIAQSWVTGDQRVGREAEKWLNAIMIKVDSHDE